MILDIPFSYKICAHLGRRHASENFTCTESASIYLAEFAAEAAPVAIVCQSPGEDPIPYRAIDGRLVRAALHLGQPLTPETLLQALEDVEVAFDKLSFPALRYPRPCDIDRARLGRVVKDMRDFTLSRVLDWAANTVLIDGQVWRTAKEPALVCSVREPGRPVLRLIHDPSPAILENCYNVPFRADQAAFAKEWIFARYGKTPEFSDAVQVASPDALRLQADEWTLKSLGERAYSTVRDGTGAEDAEADEAVALLELREALNDIESDLAANTASAGPLAERLTGVLPALRRMAPTDADARVLLHACLDGIERLEAAAEISDPSLSALF